LNPDGSVSYTGWVRAHVTFDGGRTWTNYAVPFPDAYAPGTLDSAVAFDADGRAYLAALGANALNDYLPDVLVSHSTNGGRSWTAPRVVTASGPVGPVTVVNDKDDIVAWGHGNAIITYT